MAVLKVGFPQDNVVEWHGTIHYTQLCHTAYIRPVLNDTNFQVDPSTFLLKSSLPKGHSEEMKRLARPNIKMFTDGKLLPDRTMVHGEKFFESRAEHIKMVVLEI